LALELARFALDALLLLFRPALGALIFGRSTEKYYAKLPTEKRIIKAFSLDGVVESLTRILPTLFFDGSLIDQIWQAKPGRYENCRSNA
jgi:hypothetical protein